MSVAGNAPAVDPHSLRETVAAIFRAVDVPPGDAAIAADALVAAELRGVHTHGVSNLAARYVEWIERGFATAAPRWRIRREAPSVLNVDGDTGLGVVVAAQVMQEVIERAATTGLCMATIHNSRHFGMAAYHDGTPTRGPTVPAEPFRLTPLGGTYAQGSHKGYGLAATVDILCAVLGQASFGARFAQGTAAHNVAAIDVEAFQPLEEFRSAMDEFLRNLRSTPPRRATTKCSSPACGSTGRRRGTAATG